MTTTVPTEAAEKLALPKYKTAIVYDLPSSTPSLARPKTTLVHAVLANSVLISAKYDEKADVIMMGAERRQTSEEGYLADDEGANDEGADDEEADDEGAETRIKGTREPKGISEKGYRGHDEDLEGEKRLARKRTSRVLRGRGMHKGTSSTFLLSSSPSSTASNHTEEKTNEQTADAEDVLYAHDTDSGLYGGGRESDLDHYNF